MNYRQKAKQQYQTQEVQDKIEDVYPYFQYLDFIENIFEHMSPIERIMLTEIRKLRLPLYPEYPYDTYYLDFADPIKKICLEADGTYHQEKQQRRKDASRDKKLRKDGWTVHRLPARSIFSLSEDDKEQAEKMFVNRAQHILKQIREKYRYRRAAGTPNKQESRNVLARFKVLNDDRGYKSSR